MVASTFRDAMSHIPTSVSILSIYNGIVLSACTISSIVSVSISDLNPEILFVLKKESHTGEEIKKNLQFSISVLSHSQTELADFFSKPREINRDFDSTIWSKRNSKFLQLIGCKIFMECELSSIYTEHLADIYIARVLNYEFSKNSSSLIYDERKYGTFHPNS